MPTTNTSNLTGTNPSGADLRDAVTLVRYWIIRHQVLSLTIGLLAAVVLIAALRLLTAASDGASPVVPAATAASTPDAQAGAAADQSFPSETPLARTSDPDTFARAVAETVFTWDTSSTSLADLSERLLLVADPTGEETPGLLVDLRIYLPSDQAWTHLAQYRTRQWIEITDVIEPDAWSAAVAQAPDGALATGTTARTVTGVRHRAGVWDDEPATASSPVQFTVFLVCSPSDDECHLLRLPTPGLALY